MEYRQRAANITGTGRTNFRFTVQEWQEIDQLADALGVAWADWARQIVKASPHLPMSEAIRKTLREDRQAERCKSIFDEGADSHPFVRASRFGEPSALKEIRADFEQQWAIDCGGFIVRIGFNRQNGPADPMLYIENQLKTGLDMAFASSFDLEDE
jgi:hypothetical protein